MTEPTELRPGIASKRWPGAVHELLAAIDKALAPKREDRYATAADMQADVDAYVETLEDRRGCREVGKITTETFFEDRHKIQQIVEQEMRRDTERDVGDLPFLEIGPMSETSDSKARRGGTGVTGSLSFGSLSRKESQPGETSTIPSVSVRDSSSLPPPKKPVVPILIGALGLGVLAGIAFVVLRTPKATSEATASPATSAASLTLRIESTPPGATVREGERVLGETPLTVSNPSGGPARDFTLLLGGHDPYTLHASSVTTDLTLMANLKESVGGSAGSAAVAEPVDVLVAVGVEAADRGVHRGDADAVADRVVEVGHLGVEPVAAYLHADVHVQTRLGREVGVHVALDFHQMGAKAFPAQLAGQGERHGAATQGGEVLLHVVPFGGSQASPTSSVPLPQADGATQPSSVVQA